MNDIQRAFPTLNEMYRVADVLEVLGRIGCDTDRVNLARRQGEAQKVELGLRGNIEVCQRIRVVTEILAFNLNSTEQEEIGALRGLIEGVAYGDHEGYRFPSVRREDVPKTHALALGLLEAVRRGANVTGSAGDQAEMLRRLSVVERHKKRPFINFPDALALYVDLWGKQESESVVSSLLMALNISGKRGAETTPSPVDLKQSFLRAVQLHQAQGAILLTCVDGRDQLGQGRDHGSSPSAENLVIHVDPAWFADLVRRVVDVRLLEPAQQGVVIEALRESAPASSMLALSTQHERFFRAGEVSRDYLKFLWLRDMKLGPASTETSPLEMSEDDIDVMVSSLLDIRFMFRVKDERGGVIPDRYIVSSCLPDHAGCDVGPEKMLEIKVGGAIFSQKLEFIGVHHFPPGLVPRLLAWCGRGRGRIKACWKRGVCFAYQSHLVLVHEGWAPSGTSSMACHAMGSAHDETAAGTLIGVIQEIDLLIRDKVYGFPGMGLLCRGEIEKVPACSDGELEAMVGDLESALEDHMNVKIDELARKSEKIAGGEQRSCLIRQIAGIYWFFDPCQPIALSWIFSRRAILTSNGVLVFWQVVFKYMIWLEGAEGCPLVGRKKRTMSSC